MTCYRCSYCCYYLNVIVSPKYSNLEDINFESLDLPEDLLIGIDGSFPCPHLSWDEEKDRSVCNVHEKTWFVKTPCYSHNYERDCLVGKYIIDHKEQFLKLKEKVKK